MKKQLAKFIPKLYGTYYNFLAIFSKRAAALESFEILCTVRKGRVLPNQRAFLDDAKYKTLKVADHDIQLYKWSGSGPKVLLMHGWESNTFRWRNLLSQLRENGFEVIAFDAPAHGYSSGKKLHVPLYSEVAREVLDTEKPLLLVAHSVGGMAVHYTHFLNPKSSVEKVVTLGSPSEFLQFFSEFKRLTGINDRVWEGMDDLLHEKFGFRMKEFSSASFAKKNTKKGLLVHDVYDKQVPVDASKKVHQNWDGSELMITEGYGHSLHQKEVSNKVIEFLKSA